MNFMPSCVAGSNAASSQIPGRHDAMLMIINQTQMEIPMSTIRLRRAALRNMGEKS